MVEAVDGPSTLRIPPLWNRSEDGQRMHRDVTAKDFMAIIGLVNEIAMTAESLDHHPDLHVHGWNKLRIETTSHDVGHLTERDVALANRVDALLGAKGLND